MFDRDAPGIVGDPFEQEHRGAGIDRQQGGLTGVGQGGLDTVDRPRENYSPIGDLGIQGLCVVEGFEQPGIAVGGQAGRPGGQGARSSATAVLTSSRPGMSRDCAGAASRSHVARAAITYRDIKATRRVRDSVGSWVSIAAISVNRPCGTSTDSVCGCAARGPGDSGHLLRWPRHPCAGSVWP